MGQMAVKLSLMNPRPTQATHANRPTIHETEPTRDATRMDGKYRLSFTKSTKENSWISCAEISCFCHGSDGELDSGNASICAGTTANRQRCVNGESDYLLFFFKLNTRSPTRAGERRVA